MKWNKKIFYIIIGTNTLFEIPKQAWDTVPVVEWYDVPVIDTATAAVILTEDDDNPPL